MNNDLLEREKAISEIDKISNEIRSLWSDLNTYDVNKLNDSWNDPVAKEYISKVQNVDNTINKIISYLDVVKECWKNYKADESSEGESINE